MKFVFGKIADGWVMFGLLQNKRQPVWFIGFSKAVK
jgi:hypothetical protein